jgi:hypothetical protein
METSDVFVPGNGEVKFDRRMVMVFITYTIHLETFIIRRG